MQKIIDFITKHEFLSSAIVVLTGIIIYVIIRVIIKHLKKLKITDKKKSTALSLISSISGYFILFLVIISVLRICGVDTTALFASVGVASIVVGLALKDIAAEFLSGLTILFGNHYSIGDTVEINGFLGEVTDFGLLNTKVKAFTGETMIISNSVFKKVVNYSFNNTTHFIELDVSYDTDIENLEKILEDMRTQVEAIDGYTGNYKLLGISSFSENSIKYMTAFDCEYRKRLQAKRDFFGIVRKTFVKEGISVPFNQMDVHIKEN